MAGPFDLTASVLNHPGFDGTVGIRKRSRVFHAAKQNLAQNEIAQLIPVKAGERVLHCTVEVLTADAAAGTFAVGDGDLATGYFAAVNQAVLGISSQELVLTTGTPNTVADFGDGKVYAVADTIDIKALGASGMTTAVVRVTAFILPLNERSA